MIWESKRNNAAAPMDMENMENIFARHDKKRPIYYGRNSRDQFVVQLIIIGLDVSIKSNELLMSRGCIVGLITPLFQKH